MRDLVSLTDGYAFDLQHGQYCLVDDQAMIDQQVRYLLQSSDENTAS